MFLDEERPNIPETITISIHQYGKAQFAEGVKSAIEDCDFLLDKDMRLTLIASTETLNSDGEVIDSKKAYDLSKILRADMELFQGEDDERETLIAYRDSLQGLIGMLEARIAKIPAD